VDDHSPNKTISAETATTPPRPKARILVVDDHPLVRRGAVQLVNRQPDLETCGEAATIEEATEAVARAKPDLVLLDLQLESGDTLEFIKLLKAQSPRIRILILSQYDESFYAERTLRAGADGYLMKEEAVEQVVNAIRNVLAGEIYVSRRMSAQLLNRLLHGRTARGPATEERLSGLSERELQVLNLLGTGKTSRQIAEELKLSIKTIETYRENLKQKLGLQNAPELIRFALRRLDSKPPENAAP
jgi:DNA-binding NarL/FixJ family response regulator